MTWGGDEGEQAESGYPPSSTGCGKQLGACWEGARGDRRRGQTPWGGTAAPHRSSDATVESAAGKERSLDLNSGFFVEEQVSNKNNAWE